MNLFFKKNRLLTHPLSRDPGMQIPGLRIAPHYLTHWFEDLPTITAYALFIIEYGEIGAAVLARYGDVELAEEIVSENYVGEYKSKEDSVRSIMKENGDIPDFLHQYIDYKKVTKEWLELDYFVVRLKNRCHVFRR